MIAGEFEHFEHITGRQSCQNRRVGIARLTQAFRNSQSHRHGCGVMRREDTVGQAHIGKITADGVV